MKDLCIYLKAMQAMHGYVYMYISSTHDVCMYLMWLYNTMQGIRGGSSHDIHWRQVLCMQTSQKMKNEKRRENQKLTVMLVCSCGVTEHTLVCVTI